MSKTTDKKIALPKVASQAEWQKARDALLKKEKEATHARDTLAAERRRLPMVKVDKPYTFDGPTGKKSLLDLFEGRRQLFLYHFMFAPSVKGWPDAGCVGCSMVADQFGRVEHLNAKDASLCMVSLAPLKNIEKYKKRMGWTYPWYSSEGTDFNKDFGLTTPKGEIYGLSVFINGGKDVYRTYFTNGRGVEGLNAWTLLDLLPYGRQEDWEDSPAGFPQAPPYGWWRRHDEYNDPNAEVHG